MVQDERRESEARMGAHASTESDAQSGSDVWMKSDAQRGSDVQAETTAREGSDVRTRCLTSPAHIKRIMEKHGFAFSKSLGQNFLIDSHAVDRIVDAVERLAGGGLVIEIGPGFGVLTERLCGVAERVIAIEKDKTLPPILRELVPAENLEIVCEDVLRCDLDQIIADAGFESAVVVANLPYYITTPIIMKVLEDAQKVAALVVMMQKEVADRLLDSGDRGAITMTAAYYAKSSRVAIVRRNSFMPAPKVDSSVIQMVRIPPALPPAEERMFHRAVRAIYAARRKTLVNALKSLNLCDKNALNDAIIKAGCTPEIRGETLDIQALLLLAKTLVTLEER